MKWTVIECLMLAGLLLAGAADALDVRGRIVNAEEEPVSGAQVWLAQTQDTRIQESDTEGQFQFDRVPVGNTSVLALKDGHALGGFTGLLVEDAELEITLEKPATLKVRIIDREYTPVPGAQVQVLYVRERLWVPVAVLAEHGFPRLRADDDAIIDMDFLPEHSFVQMVVAHYAHADSSVAYLPVGADKTHQVILQKGFPLRGRVTFENEGVEDARVAVLRTGVESQRKYAEVRTDPEGMYSLRVPRGEYLVTVAHPEYGSPLPKTVRLLEDEDEAHVLDLRVKSPRYIEGKVLLPDGGPCAGTPILFLHGDIAHSETFTNAAGAFELRLGVPEGMLRVLPPPGFMTESLADIPVDMGDKRRVKLSPIRLKPLPEIQGVVLDEGGAPAGRALIASTDLPWKIWALSDETGRFGFQLQHMPEQGKAKFMVEDAARLLRKPFTVRLNRVREKKVRLEPFEPDQRQRPPTPEYNDLSGLVNEPAPEIACQDWYNTSPVSLQSLRGKVVVLHFWGGFDTSPRGLARLEALRAHFDLLQPSEDVFFLGVHDGSATADEVEDYVHRYGIKFPVGRDTGDFDSFTAYGIHLIPQTVLVDKEGVLRYYQVEGRLLELIKVLRRR